MKFLIILLPFHLFAQNAVTQLSAPIKAANPDDNESAASIFADRAQWQEVVSERKLNSRTYITPDGKTIIRNSSKALNYYNLSGELVPIDPALTLNSDGKGWSAMNQPHPVYVYPDGSFALSMDHDQLCSFGKNCSVNGNWNYDSRNITVDNNNTIVMHDVVPGVSRITNIRENAVKYNYVIDHAMNLSSTYFTCSEELDLPSGYFLRRDNSEGREENGGWTGNFEIVSGDGKVNGVIFAPVI
ncbi:MAG TPA: hypothetical protein VL651_02375, partial [Bacteroidia bacterium]|nr:hypothetical protein [Bacteroidia bacterium]